MRPEESLGRLLKERDWTIGVAESCTGGLLSVRLTDVPGSSAYFRGAVVAYHNDLKEGMLGVPSRLIRQAGAVSEEVAREMAQGARRLLNVDVGVAVTGIAGPGGGTREKPVGLVFVAVATPSALVSRSFRFAGGRTANREDSVDRALELLLAVLGR